MQLCCVQIVAGWKLALFLYYYKIVKIASLKVLNATQHIVCLWICCFHYYCVTLPCGEV